MVQIAPVVPSARTEKAKRHAPTGAAKKMKKWHLEKITLVVSFSPCQSVKSCVKSRYQVITLNIDLSFVNMFFVYIRIKE
jgi:hypothetical protein